MVDLLASELGEDQAFILARDLHNSYSPFMQDLDVWYLIKEIVPDSVLPQVAKRYEAVGAHRFVNDVVMEYYPSEKIIKYHLARQRLDKENEITAFEVNVGNSRLDLGVINGNSYAFEIKTELDSLAKLEKQMDDYSMVFEFISVVVHPRHLDKVTDIIAPHCGIKTYKLAGCNCKFKTVRKAEKSPLLDPLTQITNLNSKELEFILRLCGYTDIPRTRIEREAMILDKVARRSINSLFKKALKNRFATRWQHVRRNFHNINPVDLQTFFSALLDPQWIYYKNSSIVYK